MSLRRAVLVILLHAGLIGVAACNGFDQKRYLPTSADFQAALVLSADKTSIPADGFSTATITASITRDAAPSRRTIVFSTTNGTFAGSGEPETTKIEATVDSSGTASVQLRSSRTIESATVTATVKTVDGLA